MNIPVRLSQLILERKKSLSVMGANNGMVDTITAPMVEETIFRPKLSPMKYRKGSKKASNKNHFRSALFKAISFLVLRKMIKSKTELTTNLRKTTVMGLKDSKACLIQTNEKAQQIIESNRLNITFGFSGIDFN